MKIGRATAFAAVMLIMLGGVIISSSLGLFDTESSKSAAIIKAGEFEGKADPNDIRGSFSFADISKQFGIEAAVLAEAFGIEGEGAEISAFQLKGLEEKYAGLPQEIGTSSVRLFVGFMTGLPVDLGAYVPLQAADIIRRSALGLTEERISYLGSHTIDLTERAEDAGNADTSNTTAEEALSDQSTAPAKPSESLSKPAGNQSKPVSQKASDEGIPEASEEATQPASAQEAASGSSVEETLAASKSDIAPGEAKEPSEITGTGNVQAAQPEAAVSQPPVSEEHETKKEDRSVKGNTTIFDMMSWGVSRELIGPAIGVELPKDNGAKLRDIIIGAGKSFEDAKVILQKMVDESN